MSRLLTYDDVLAWLERRVGGRRTRLVAIDGHGGAGKSTFARRLAAGEPHGTIIHTDDFAKPGLHNGVDVERLLHGVIQPLARDEDTRYQRFDWLSQRLAEWHVVLAGGLVVVEGVSAMRNEFASARWDLSVWVETPRETCLRRGLARDGVESEHHWLEWFREEDRYVARDDPRSRADMVVSGLPSAAHDADREFVVLVDRRSAR